MDTLRTSFDYGEFGGTSGIRVLVADDLPSNRRLLGAIFGSCGCSVTFADDGAEALAMALAQPFDLVCLDRRMPGLSGDEVAARLFAAFQDMPRPFVALCTSDPDGAAAVDAVLCKPLRLHQIVDMVARALAFRAKLGKSSSGSVSYG